MDLTRLGHTDIVILEKIGKIQKIKACKSFSPIEAGISKQGIVIAAPRLLISQVLLCWMPNFQREGDSEQERSEEDWKDSILVFFFFSKNQ